MWHTIDMIGGEQKTQKRPVEAGQIRQVEARGKPETSGRPELSERATRPRDTGAAQGAPAIPERRQGLAPGQEMGARRPPEQNASRRQAEQNAIRRPGQGPTPVARRKKNSFATLLFGFFVLALLFAIASVSFSIWMKNHYAADLITVDAAAGNASDCVLVLGCGVYRDGSPTPMLRDRVEMGVRLYFKGAAPKLLLSGDHGQKDYDEVSAMKKIALDAGVREEDIFLDHAGFSTWDSLKRAKEVFGVKKLCIVSQKYHLYRALYCADALGMDMRAVASDSRRYTGQFLRELRELLSRDKAFFSVLFNPDAEIMGTAISLAGDGRQTWD